MLAMGKIAWWQRGVIYQVYPRSFQDTDGDGVGDLKGIKERLSYLSWLGVDAIWISPIYPSPMADFGYDVSNYCDIDPLFGSLHEFDQLIAAAHKEGSGSFLISFPIILRIITRGLSKAVYQSLIQKEIGTSGGPENQTGRHLTIGCLNLADRHGLLTLQHANSTCIASCVNSPI
jgi:hypothetical protein